MKQIFSTKQDKLKSLDFDSIEHVHDAAWQLIWQKHRIITIGVVVISIIVFASPLFLTRYLIGSSLFNVSIIGLAIPALYYGYFSRRARAWFMQQFAAVNNLEYQATLALTSVKGRLFEVGHSKNIKHSVSTTYQDHPLKLFHYHYTVGHGKSSVRYKFTVAEIFFEKVEFPHILLQSRTMSKYGAKGKNMHTISLEEEFSGLYQLHATEGYEIEIFQIFTPKVLRFLKEKGPHFSIEFADDRLYIYDDVIIANKKQLHEMYSVTQQIFDSIGPLLNRLHDDFAVLHPYYNK